MSLSSLPRRAVLALAVVCIPAATDAADFVWAPPPTSDWQWTTPSNWLSDVGGAPGTSDTAIFTHLPQTAKSDVAVADPNPATSPPVLTTLSVRGIDVFGFHEYDSFGKGLVDWRIELSRLSLGESQTPLTNQGFALDLDNGIGLVKVGFFQEPNQFGDPATAIPGGMIITGSARSNGTYHQAPAGFRGQVDVRHGRLTLQDINYDDHDALTTIGGVVDSRDDLSYIPQRLPTAELTIDHSHFNAFKTKSLLIGTVGKATARLLNSSQLNNLKELRVGGNASQNIGSHERSDLTLVDSSMTVGDGAGGGVWIGDLAAPDLIDTYNGTLTMTRSSIAPSPIRDSQGAIIGMEPLDMRVGHFGLARAQLNDASSITARRLFVGEKPFSFGELRVNSSSLDIIAPSGPETPDRAGRFSVGSGGLGFVVVTGTSDAPSTISARSMTLGRVQNGYGDVYLDRNSVLTLKDSAWVGIGGQGRLTLTGRFDVVDPTTGRNTYFSTSATVGTRPLTSDPQRNYTITIGNNWASAGFLVVGEGGRLDSTDQPLNGIDELDPNGIELWRSSNHRLVVGNEGLGFLTVHADGLVRSERLLVGEGALGVGQVLLQKSLLNASAASMNGALPGTLRVSRGATIGVNGNGSIDVRGTDVLASSTPATTAESGLITAALTLGDNSGSRGTARVVEGGQVVVNGTIAGERDLIVARQGSGFLEIGDALVLSEAGVYISGGTGGLVRVLHGHTQIGGADAKLYANAKGTVTVHPEALLSVETLTLGGVASLGDSLTVETGAIANVPTVGGGFGSKTFAGGTVRADHVEVRGGSHLAIESSPLPAPADPERDGGFHVANGIDVYGGVLRLGDVERTRTGTVSSDVTLHAGQLTGGGTIAGDLSVSGGTVAMLVNGTNRFTGYDSFTVSDVASFASGGISVSGTLTGQVGQRFDLFTFSSGSRTTTFDVLSTLAVQQGGQWVSFLNGNAYTLAVAGATGDANCDGAVDFDDLLVLAQNYSGPGPASWVTGDFNDDQVVNFDDLLALAQNYGTSLLGEATVKTQSFAGDWALAMSLAPEPSSAMLLALAATMSRRRRAV